MKEKHFLNLSSEIPKLSKNEADQLKGGFKKVATKPSVHVNAIHSDENLVPLRLNLQYLYK